MDVSLSSTSPNRFSIDYEEDAEPVDVGIDMEAEVSASSRQEVIDIAEHPIISTGSGNDLDADEGRETFVSCRIQSSSKPVADLRGGGGV